MSSLTRLAFDILQDQSAVPGTKHVACYALLHALDQVMDVPDGTHLAIWRHLLVTDAGAFVLRRHELSHPDVARDAMRVLVEPECGENTRDLALAALCSGENARSITDTELFNIADRIKDEDRIRRVGRLVEYVHEQRGLSSEILTSLRDRFACSSLPGVRVVAVEIGALLPRLDERFAVRVLNDEWPEVRTAGAHALERANHLDRERAVALLKDHFQVEPHAGVASACHYAFGALVGGID